MKRSKLIQDLVKIYETRPEECSSYHIIDMLIYAAERRGMVPSSIERPMTYEEQRRLNSMGFTKFYGDDDIVMVNEWEPEDEDLDSDAEARKSFWEPNQEIKIRKLSDIFEEMDENKKRTPTKQQLDELAEVLNNIESEDEE